MVEFVSLLLGLVLGPMRVEVAVDPAVAEVVFELDGELAGELSGPPWELSIDLGDQLRPRRLEARALGAAGEELDRATRLLNVYRPPTEVDYAVHRNPDGRVTMVSLSWKERGGARPRRSAVAVDGRPVDFEDPGQVWLPPLDPGELHVIESVVEYTDGVVARDQIGVGGPVLGEGSARLTAVPVTLPASAPRLEPEAVSARLAASGERLRVLGVERGDSEIVFVRDHAAGRAVELIGPARPTMGALGGGRDAQAARVIRAVPFRDGERARLLEPGHPADAGTEPTLQRAAAPLVSDHEGGFGLFWHLKQVDASRVGERGAPISDAVAIAASRAAFGSRRRVVVLVLAADSVDRGSRLGPPRVRGYLEALGVPLHVWYLGKPAKAPPAWGPAMGVRSLGGMEDALEEVRAALERQRIVWVEGVHLPGEVEIELAPRSGSAGD